MLFCQINSLEHRLADVDHWQSGEIKSVIEDTKGNL